MPTTNPTPIDLAAALALANSSVNMWTDARCRNMLRAAITEIEMLRKEHPTIEDIKKRDKWIQQLQLEVDVGGQQRDTLTAENSRLTNTIANAQTLRLASEDLIKEFRAENARLKDVLTRIDKTIDATFATRAVQIIRGPCREVALAPLDAKVTIHD